MKMIQIPRTMKAKVRIEQAKVFAEMTTDGISKEDWEMLNERYKAYEAMIVRKSLTITPDAILAAATSLAGILLIGNFERLEPFISKAVAFIPKVRV